MDNQPSYNKMDSEEEDKSSFNFQEDADLRPEELSGDENGQQSVFANQAGAAKSNFILTSVTVAKTVIGAAILSIPYVVSQMGYALVIIIFIFALMLNQFGSVLLLKAKNLSRHSNFATIFYEVWRSKLSKGLGSILIFINNIGICIAEMIIFKTSIVNIFKDVIKDQQVLDSFYTQGWFIVLVVSFFEVPPVLVSKMEKLKFMALAGIVGIVVFMTVFVIFFITAVADSNPDNQPVGNMRAFPENWLLAAATVPNLLLALSYQMNFFPIFKGMSGANDSKMIKAVTTGLTFCLCSYLLIGILAYAYVGPEITPNFLQSLKIDKLGTFFFIIINFSFLSSLFFAFPIMFFGGRNNFIALVKLVMTKDDNKKPLGKRMADEVEEISSYINPNIPIEQRRKKARILFIVYTMILYLVTIGAAMGLDDIEVVFNAVGAICSTSIALLLPCFFYVRLIVLKGQPKNIKYYLAIAIMAVMAPYAIFSIIALQVAEE